VTHRQPPKSAKPNVVPPPLSVDDVLASALKLSSTQREELVTALLQFSSIETVLESLPDAETAPLKRCRRRGRAARIEAKLIKGCGPYYYYRWWSDKTYRSTYLGKTLPV